MSILCVDGERVESNKPLEVGDTIKVQLPALPDGFVECPWADVVELLPDGRWLGRIANPLIQPYAFDFGDCIVFERMDDGHHWWWQPLEDANTARVN